MKAFNVNRITSTGGIFIFWVADWFALLNNKMGGDLEKIQIVGRYFIEVWRAAGMNLKNVKFLWASEEINKKPDEYWRKVIDISRHNTVSRMKRCALTMGRAESDDMPAAQILYPCMQCADIFFLKADIC
jgi:tyrosyl-tRNA synthetase